MKNENSISEKPCNKHGVNGSYSDEVRHFAYEWFDSISTDELHILMEKYSKPNLVEKDIIEMYVGEHNCR